MRKTVSFTLYFLLPYKTLARKMIWTQISFGCCGGEKISTPVGNQTANPWFPSCSVVTIHAEL